MNIQKLKKIDIPDKPGVYFFYKKGSILYIGKATSLKDRTKSYFNKDVIGSRGPLIIQMVKDADTLKWQETDSVLEALILESNLIKKYQPKYNTKEKDNKSFNYVCITKDSIPKVLVIRGRNIDFKNKKLSTFNLQPSTYYGPYPNGNLLKEAMKIIRRIFPYIDNDSIKKQNREFYNQLKLTPESILEYKNNIKNIKLFFEGKKKRIIFDLKKEMAAFSKSKDFENAAKIRDQIFALNHINDVALIKEDMYTSQEYNAPLKNTFQKVLGRGGREPAPDCFEKYFSAPLSYRIEAYDIAHMSGKNMVGVMTVIEDGELAKNEYRKFIIRTQSGSNDTGALEEILSRRLRHTEWGLPSIIVVDGGSAQVNITKQVLSRYQFDIPVISVLKNEQHKPKAILGNENMIKKYKKQILLLNSEAHRFAITFHRQKRSKDFIQK